jgi:hypothetical protein
MKIQHLMDDPYKEEKYERPARAATLREIVFSMYGRPLIRNVDSWDDITTIIHGAYELLQDPKTKNMAWIMLNTTFYIKKKSAYKSISESIVTILEHKFRNHAYFKYRKPDEDDFQEVLYNVLKILKTKRFNKTLGFPKILLLAITWETQNHMQAKYRQEHRGASKQEVYMVSLETDLTEGQNNSNREDMEMLEEILLRNSPETPPEAYEKALMAAWDSHQINNLIGDMNE